MDRVQPAGRIRKRKAEGQDNERLSKRLSLLNLERNGEKLYVPVESPALSPKLKTKPKAAPEQEADNVMQLDNTKHKVYIYDLDAELSDSESSDDGRLVFLPDIQKHLLESRIPASILANSEGELAGQTQNQLILYNIPSSLTVPEEQDSVRKAIIETRARARAKLEQRQTLDTPNTNGQITTPISESRDKHDWYRGMVNGTAPPQGTTLTEMEAQTEQPLTNGNIAYDPDAMDIG